MITMHSSCIPKHSSASPMAA